MSVRESSFVISASDFDTSLLPAHARQPGTDAFHAEVTKLLTKEYESFGGWARIVVSDKTIEVTWRQPADAQHPLDIAIDSLQRGDYQKGVAILQTLRREHPDHPSILFNLGMALSDQGELVEAISLLKRLVHQQPSHVNALIGLGVALERQGKSAEAIETLTKAVQQDESNPYAHRNLGACLLKSGNVSNAITHLKRSTEISPRDQSAWFGLGQAFEQSNQLKDADDAYVQAIRIDATSQLGELSKERRSAIGHQEFRNRAGGSGLRMDAVMYCLAALQKFTAMSSQQLQQSTFEIAMRGQSGYDVNDPTPKYEFKTLGGKFSGLQAVAYMYVAFRLMTPPLDAGFDLSQEYQAALNLHKAKS